MAAISTPSAAGPRLSADAFGPDLPDGRVRGVLVVERTAVRFEAFPEPIILSTAGLSCRLGGFNDERFFLSHPDWPGVDIAIRDEKARSAEVRERIPGLTELFARQTLRRRRFWFLIALGILVAAVAIVFLGAGSVLLARWLVSLF